MNIKRISYSLALTAMFAFAGTAAAQGTASAPELTMNANVQSAMQLIISTHASGATVTGVEDDFAIDFGDVNGLGLGALETNVSVDRQALGALYTSPINLTPTFSGFVDGSASITAMVGGGAHDSIAREGSSAATVAALPGTATVVIPTAASDSDNARFVGFYIARDETVGAKVATVVYEVTVD